MKDSAVQYVSVSVSWSLKKQNLKVNVIALLFV